MSNDHGESDVTPTESEATGTAGSIPHGSREIPEISVSTETDRSEKARCRNADMHGFGKSDSLIPIFYSCKSQVLILVGVAGAAKAVGTTAPQSECEQTLG